MKKDYMQMFRDNHDYASRLSPEARAMVAGYHDLPDPSVGTMAAVLTFVALETTGEDEGVRRPSGPEWDATRFSVLKRANGRCALCGVSIADGATLHVDHIKPISRFPELATDPNNLQALCAPCNLSKSARL